MSGGYAEFYGCRDGNFHRRALPFGFSALCVDTGMKRRRIVAKFSTETPSGARSVESYEVHQARDNAADLDSDLIACPLELDASDDLFGGAEEGVRRCITVECVRRVDRS